MALVTSVFLTQLLCLLVPCDPQYQSPDLRPASTSDEISESSEEISPEHFSHLEITKNFLETDQLEALSAASKKYTKTYVDNVPFVSTNAGIVEGYRIRVVGGRKIYAFEGIPYAEVPIGHLRFRPPVPKSKWKGILKATKYAPVCMQYTVPQAFRTIGQEDCLYLNVYSPRILYSAHDELLPVIVFIHGGGFFFGSGATYGPSYFLQRDVVLVTLNYRLGVLGFLSTGDNVIPGNMGLKDQTLALRWINENIISFGGDPNRVTIMGQSAGSACVHLHMMSQLSRPYFARAVSLSGTAFNYWSFFDPYQTRNLTNSLAKNVGCPTEDSVLLMECLREKNPVDLVAQTPLFLDDWPHPNDAFKPTVEVIEGNPQPFLVDFPENIYRRNEVANVPWIVTLVSGEGYAFLLFPFISFAFPTLQRNWYKLALDLIDADNLDIDREKVIKRLTRYYFRNTPPEKSAISTYAQIVTDRMFITGVYEAAKAHVQVAPTYSYLFDFNGQYNQITNYGYPASEWGVAHTEDVFYFFNSTRVYNGFQKGDPEYTISSILVNVFANFAAKGVPLYTNSDGEDIEIWKPHQDPNNLNFLGINSIIAMIGDPFRKKIKFWRRLRLPDTPVDVVVSGQ